MSESGSAVSAKSLKASVGGGTRFALGFGFAVSAAIGAASATAAASSAVHEARCRRVGATRQSYCWSAQKSNAASRSAVLRREGVILT